MAGEHLSLAGGSAKPGANCLPGNELQANIQNSRERLHQIMLR